MRRKELLEGKVFDELDFVSPKDGGREINFDIVDDLIHFMNNDDHSYRRHVYPAIAKIIDLREVHKKTKPSILKNAVEECYRNYIQHFPIRELPDNIDEDVCEQVCSKMHEEVIKHIADGLYKD